VESRPRVVAGLTADDLQGQRAGRKVSINGGLSRQADHRQGLRGGDVRDGPVWIVIDARLARQHGQHPPHLPRRRVLPGARNPHSLNRSTPSVQEDEHISKEFNSGMGLFAVFDGHGGKEASTFCKKHFQQQVCPPPAPPPSSPPALVRSTIHHHLSPRHTDPPHHPIHPDALSIPCSGAAPLSLYASPPHRPPPTFSPTIATRANASLLYTSTPPAASTHFRSCPLPTHSHHSDSADRPPPTTRRCLRRQIDVFPKSIPPQICQLSSDSEQNTFSSA
jgi:hypothetical protein